MVKGKSRSRELESKWRHTLARHRDSGLTVREFCRVEGVKESGFHYWKRELKRRGEERPSSARRVKTTWKARPSLVPVTLRDGWLVPVEISLASGRIVRVSSGCDEPLLRMVIGVLDAS
jgi:hypothetical protein